MTIQQEYFSITQAAKYLGVSRSTIKRWIYDTEKINAVKVVGTVRIHRDEIERIINPIEREEV